MRVFERNKIFGDVCMIDVEKEYRDTMQEVLLELKLKTDKRLKKLEEEHENDKIQPKTY